MQARPAPKVLIVEDERIVASDLQGSLNEMGYDAFAIASSAEETLACAASKCPDVVLMDIRIKGPSDGIETAAILKRKFSISVIYLTAHADDAMIDRAKRTDPHAFLLKPVKLAELRSMIEIVLHRRELEHELRKSHERTRELAQRLATVREEEQREVATRLHDGVAQELFAMKLDLGRLEALSQGSGEAKRVFDEINVAVTRCMESVREVANDLRPAALAHNPVTAVIAEHARHFEERSGLKIEVAQMDAFPERLGEATQLLLFRTAQEALTNVARHARAAHVKITLGVDEGRITLDIEDDGVGIADGAMNKPRSLGLLALRERFATLGGGLAVRRASAGGTRMSAHLPQPKDPSPHER